jgi:hypothetical protein
MSKGDYGLIFKGCCFQNKNPNLGKFWRSLDRLRCWYIFWPFEIFYRHLGYFMTLWYILCSFGTFYPVSVSSTTKNLATLVGSCNLHKSS